MKLQTRLCAGFVAVVGMMVPIVVISFLGFREIDKEFESLKTDIVPGMLATAEMKRAATVAHHHLMEYMLRGKEADEESTESFLADLKNLGRVHLEHEHHIGPVERDEAEKLLREIGEFTSAIMGIIDLKKGGVSDDELSGTEDETVHPAEAVLISRLDAHSAVHMQELAEAERAVHAAGLRGMWMVVTMGVVAVVVAVAVGVVTARSIAAPLGKMNEATKRVAGGDLFHRIDMERKDEIGDLAGRFDAMTESLSETVVSRDSLEQANAALQKSEEGLRITLASIGDGVIATDVDGRVIRLNETGEKLTGWTAREACGKRLEEIFNIVNEETREPVENPVTRALASGKVAGMANHTILIARDGAERAIADSAAPIRDAAGEVVGGVLVFQDVTERRDHEKETERLFRALGERNKELNCLFGVSQIAGDPEASLDEMFRQTVELLPGSWRYPEIACGRICYKGQVFETHDYREGPWCQSADIETHGEKAGHVRVCYREARPEADEGPFLSQERHLIDALAERLGKIAERRGVAEDLQQRMAELAQFNRLAVGREQRMIELKREVNDMARKAHIPAPYDLAFAESGKGVTDDEA